MYYLALLDYNGREIIGEGYSRQPFNMEFDDKLAYNHNDIIFTAYSNWAEIYSCALYKDEQLIISTCLGGIIKAFNGDIIQFKSNSCHFSTELINKKIYQFIDLFIIKGLILLNSYAFIRTKEYAFTIM